MAGPLITADRSWPFGRQSTTLRSLETAYTSTLGLTGKLKDARSALEATGKYSQSGVAAEYRKVAKEQFLPGVLRAEIAVTRALKSAQEQLAGLKPAAIDKTDLVGFFRRESLRDELRAMPREQRDSMLTRHAKE